MGENTEKAFHPASSKEITRAYFDNLLLEQRLMDSGIPDTGFHLYGREFSTPIMTAALSHIGTFNPDVPDGMVEYARGAKRSDTAHWIGMGSDEEFARVAAVGAPTVRIVKPYADEEKILLQLAECVPVWMRIRPWHLEQRR